MRWRSFPLLAALVFVVQASVVDADVCAPRDSTLSAPRLGVDVIRLSAVNAGRAPMTASGMAAAAGRWNAACNVYHNPAFRASGSGESPLVLDLNGDGILTTDENHPVSFDLDADGFPDLTAWTLWESGEAFLALDLNSNGVIDDGRELFGDATLLPSGEPAANGFEALAVYDRIERGGNEDGFIDQDDAIWKKLRLWIDDSHDGISQKHELRKLHQEGVVAIDLFYLDAEELDGNANVHRFKGTYIQRVKLYGKWFLKDRAVDDVFFRIFSHDHD